MEKKIQQLIGELSNRHFTVAVAESLTAGAVAASIADVPGASKVLRGGAVTYATNTKASVLGVDSDVLDNHGPVHPLVALQMARGVCQLFGSEIGVSTTGVAGPGPADGHDAGTVYICVNGPEGYRIQQYDFTGDRNSVRQQTVEAAVELVLRFLEYGA